MPWKTPSHIHEAWEIRWEIQKLNTIFYLVLDFRKIVTAIKVKTGTIGEMCISTVYYFTNGRFPECHFSTVVIQRMPLCLGDTLLKKALRYKVSELILKWFRERQEIWQNINSWWTQERVYIHSNECTILIVCQKVFNFFRLNV